jgi:hypothetical protein
MRIEMEISRVDTWPSWCSRMTSWRFCFRRNDFANKTEGRPEKTEIFCVGAFERKKKFPRHDYMKMKIGKYKFLLFSFFSDLAKVKCSNCWNIFFCLLKIVQTQTEAAHFSPLSEQGCQIFLVTLNQNGNYIPNWPQNIPKGHYIHTYTELPQNT